MKTLSVCNCKIPTSELLELGLFSSTAEVWGFLDYEIHVERIVPYSLQLPQIY
jgi:hypothetical protein